MIFLFHKYHDKGTVTFAMAGKGTRTTQIFFNTVNNARLDKENFSPFGEVISGMEIIDRIYAVYKEKPNQVCMQNIIPRCRLPNYSTNPLLHHFAIGPHSTKRKCIPRKGISKNVLHQKCKFRFIN